MSSRVGQRKSIDYSALSEIDHKPQWNLSNVKFLGDVENHNSFPRKSHSSVAFGNQILVYGGINNVGVVLDDLVSFELGQFRWFPATQNLGSSPFPLYSHTACLMDNRNLLFILGGYREDGKPNTSVFAQDLSKYFVQHIYFSNN